MQFLDITDNSSRTGRTNNLIRHINIAHKYIEDQVDKVCYTDMLDTVIEIYLKTLLQLKNIKEPCFNNNDIYKTNLLSAVYDAFHSNYTTADYAMFLNEFVELMTLDTLGDGFNNRFIKFNYMLEPNIFRYKGKEGLNTKVNILIDNTKRDLFTIPWHLELRYILSRIGIKETLIILTLLASSRVKPIC